MDAEARITEFMAEVGRRAGDDPAEPGDPETIAGLLSELARERQTLAERIAELPAHRFGAVGLHTPDAGPRLLLVHRPDGAMSYTHSHSVWIGFAVVEGVETHQHYEVAADHGDRADLRLLEERRLGGGDVVTLVPPRDIHSHGHAPGTGGPAYVLVLSGGDQFARERREYDLDTGAVRVLPPGDFGTLHRT